MVDEDCAARLGADPYEVAAPIFTRIFDGERRDRVQWLRNVGGKLATPTAKLAGDSRRFERGKVERVTSLSASSRSARWRVSACLQLRWQAEVVLRRVDVIRKSHTT